MAGSVTSESLSGTPSSFTSDVGESCATFAGGCAVEGLSAWRVSFVGLVLPASARELPVEAGRDDVGRDRREALHANTEL